MKKEFVKIVVHKYACEDFSFFLPSNARKLSYLVAIPLIRALVQSFFEKSPLAPHCPFCRVWDSYKEFLCDEALKDVLKKEEVSVELCDGLFVKFYLVNN